jgi:hypothetical protein
MSAGLVRRQEVPHPYFLQKGEKKKKLGGNADVFENNGVAEKAICKCMKTHGMQIDGAEGATRKFLKTKSGEL